MNWGNKLLLTFVAFAAMISYLVYRAITTNYELVDKEYYKNELRYQNIIDASKRTIALSSAPEFQEVEEGISLELPGEMKNKVLTGDVFFYCAYDSRKDRRFSLNTNKEGIQVFGKSAIGPGRYTVKISWSSEETNYYSEKKLTIY